MNMFYDQYICMKNSVKQYSSVALSRTKIIYYNTGNKKS